MGNQLRFLGKLITSELRWLLDGKIVKTKIQSRRETEFYKTLIDFKVVSVALSVSVEMPRVGLRGGATGAIAPGPPFQAGPRDDI